MDVAVGCIWLVRVGNVPAGKHRPLCVGSFESIYMCTTGVDVAELSLPAGPFPLLTQGNTWSNLLAVPTCTWV